MKSSKKKKKTKNTLEEWKPDKVDGRKDDETVEKGNKDKTQEACLQKAQQGLRQNRGPQLGAHDS